MANKKGPPEHTRFKPGQSGNPGGRHRLPADIAKARHLNQVELERVINKYLYFDRQTVHAAIADPATPMMELVVASILARAADKGDHASLEFILCRMLGRVKDQLEINMPRPVIINRRDGTQLVLGAEKSDDAS